MSDENPFTPPEVEVSDPVRRSGELLDEPRKLSSGSAMSWVSEGFSIFKSAPLQWVLITVVFLVLMIVLSSIPIVSLISNIISPVLMAGFYMAAKDVSEGRSISVGHLFGGFQVNTRKLVMLGVLYTAATLLIVVLAVAAMMMGASPEDMGSLAADGGMNDAQAMAMMARAGGPMILALVLMIPLTMAYLFAPQLIVFHGMPAMEAMKRSYRACMRNMGPFLVFGLLAIFFSFLAALTFGLGFIVLVPVLSAALYVAYRDIFLSSSEATIAV